MAEACLTEKHSSLVQRVETMVSVIKLLLETLGDLSDAELEDFKDVLQKRIPINRRFSDIPWKLLMLRDMRDTVFLMVQTDGQKSVEMTKEVLKRMKRTDLVQSLSDSSSGSESESGLLPKKHSDDKHLAALIHKVATMSAVKELLLETLNDLSKEELKNFRWFLQFTFFQRGLPHITWSKLLKADCPGRLVDLMVYMCGQQSVEVTKEVFMDMNRTDLVQKLSDTSSGPKEKHSVDEHWPALTQKVETMVSVIKLLLETLAGLGDWDLNNISRSNPSFKQTLLSQTDFYRYFSDIPLMLLHIENMQDIVFLMVLIYGQQSVEMTKEVLKRMKRTDLVQSLSDSSSGCKIFSSEKHSADEHHSALIQKVATMAAVKHLLLETLNDLSNKELEKFKEFLQLIFYQKDLPDISSTLSYMADRAKIVDQMLQTYSKQSVELTREVFMDMNRTDLVQKLSDTSSGPKGQHFVYEHRPALFERAAPVMAVKQILLEILKDLSLNELEEFKWLLQFTYFQKSLPQISWSQLDWAGSADLVVDLMVGSQQSVEVTKEVFMDMNRTDLVERLSETSSGLKEKHLSTPFQKEVSTMTSLQEKLLEILKDLSYGELGKFKRFLQRSEMRKGLPRIPRHRMKTSDRVKIVALMVEIYGQQSVEVTREVLKMMNRTNLVQRLSDISSGSKEKHLSTPFQKEVTMTSLQEKLLEILKDLSYGELGKFKRFLQRTEMKKGLPRIPRHRMKTSDRVKIVALMVEIYGQQSVEVTREVLKMMNRTNLVQRLSDISSGSKGPSRSLELEGCGSIMQDSSDWTKLEPEVKSTDADEAPTYSLQSEAGKFECSVSGLYWVCKEKVSFKYQFWSWGEHMERMESIKYMPAGPLMDITVIAGKFDEVYLPHWICIDDDPKISDKFAVLHIDDCGDVVEKVAEITPSHVKLTEPVFSPRAVLMKAGFSVKINCKVLIYKTNTAFLTLHVYVIPCDPGLQQELDRRELSYGYKVIRKPHPEKSLKMHDRFILTADLDSAEILPEKLKLRYESRDPNFFEVFIENPDRSFTLKLTPRNEHQPVWTCVIRKDEYQSTGHIQGEHFVDKHQCDLIERVSNIWPILDHLLRERVIQQEDYDGINARPTTQEKMRKLCSGPLKAAGPAGKDIFYKILAEKESYLVADLNSKES